MSCIKNMSIQCEEQRNTAHKLHKTRQFFYRHLVRVRKNSDDLHRFLARSINFQRKHQENQD